MITIIYLYLILFADIEKVTTFEGKPKNLFVERDIKKVDLVNIFDYISDTTVEIMYSTKYSMFKEDVYGENICLLKKEVAEKLKKADDILRSKHNLKLKFWDCYRPWSVQKKMWELFPKMGYVAHPSSGSHHNRGCAVDVTLTDLDGNEIKMPTAFDELSFKASHKNMNLPKEVIKNRETLKSVMESVGFLSIRSEWWHYNLPKSYKLPVIDIELSKFNKKTNEILFPPLD